MNLFSSIRSLSPLGIENELLAFLLRLGDGNEVGADPACFDDLVGDPVIIEPEMASRAPRRGS